MLCHECFEAGLTTGVESGHDNGCARFVRARRLGGEIRVVDEVGEPTQRTKVVAVFTPQPGRYYQFEMTSGSSGTCKASPSLIERHQSGSGWHLTPNLEVTYPHDGPRAKTSYSDERYKDSTYKPFTPGQPPN